MVEKEALLQVYKESPLYSKLGIEYQHAYSGIYEPLDFEGVIAALKEGRVSGYGRPMVGDLSNEEMQRLYDISPNIWYMDFLDGDLTNASKWLLGKGFQPQIQFTQIIDLTKEPLNLHGEIRKSYKSLINKGKRELDIKITEDPLLLSQFHALHRQVSGRETRSHKTWDIQAEMLKQKEAFLVCGFFDKYLLAGDFFIYNEHCCYYGVSASAGREQDIIHPEVSGQFKFPLNTHALIWRAIMHAKELGCKRLEMGEQLFCGNEKLVDISMFKRGFGGQTRARLVFKNYE